MRKTLILAVFSTTIGATAALACPPYVERCYESNMAQQTIQRIQAERCISNCTGALLVSGHDIYKVAGKNTRVTVTVAKARALLKDRPAYLVYRLDDAWSRASLDYLVSAAGK